MSFTNVGEASPKKKRLVREFLSNGDRKGGRDFASFVLWNVPFIDLRELNVGETLPVLCFVLFCFCGLNALFNDSRRLIDKFGRGFASLSCGIADSMSWVHLANEGDTSQLLFLEYFV